MKNTLLFLALFLLGCMMWWCILLGGEHILDWQLSLDFAFNVIVCGALVQSLVIAAYMSLKK